MSARGSSPPSVPAPGSLEPIRASLDLSRVAQIVEAVPALPEMSRGVILEAERVKLAAVSVLSRAEEVTGWAEEIWGKVAASGQWSDSEMSAALEEAAPKRPPSDTEAERDRLRAEVDTLRVLHDSACEETHAIMAEVERLRQRDDEMS